MEKEKALRDGKQVVTPGTHSVSQPDIPSVPMCLRCEKLCCHEQSRHVYYILCSVEKQGTHQHRLEVLGRCGAGSRSSSSSSRTRIF